jgi:uncharacterized membrane protein YheB (UPF0754 family)
VVGCITNWIALKWIFEPLTPTRVGPFVLQGMFLRRQKEVSAEFSAYIATNVLNSQRMWSNMLRAAGGAEFRKIVSRNVPLSSGPVGDIMKQLVSKVGNSVSHPLHAYTDARLGLRQILIEKMGNLSPAQFEQVLHPIFQKDEFTLILAGGVLGAAAGALQLGINILVEKREITRKRSAAMCAEPNSCGREARR